MCKSYTNLNNYKTTIKHTCTPIPFYKIIQKIDLLIRAQKGLCKEKPTVWGGRKGINRNLKVVGSKKGRKTEGERIMI